jgi:hypothetical protein
VDQARIPTEPDLFRSYWDDGLLDLLSGLALLVTGIGWAGELGALAIVQAPCWIVLWRPLRRRIVEPRAGFVTFSAARRSRAAGMLRATAVLGLGALVLAALAAAVTRQRGATAGLAFLAPGLPAALVGVAAFAVALMTGARRFHAYGLLLLAGALATAVVAGGPALPLAAAGLVTAGSGALLLTRFLRKSRSFVEGA